MTHGLLKTAAMAAAACLAAGCDNRRPAEPIEPVSAAPAGSAASSEASSAPLAKAAADPGLQWGACPSPFPAGCELTVLHGDPARPNADVFLRVPGGYEIPAHSHTSAERMVLVGGRMQVQYRGHPQATLEPGTYAYGPARLPHRASCAAGGPCILFIAFEGPVDVEPFEGTI